jgi:malate dehydrogenase (quinone)
VGGKWLKCINPEVISCHHAKVYGQAEVGAPPMSVPHLDSRMINGERQMLFGPYAGFSTKFLKHGSLWDLPSSLDFDNLMPMIEVGIYNMPLTKYLIEQVRMSFHEKFAVLKKFYPTAQEEDWELIEAGQRVQIIKKDEHGDGILEFGTELIATKDGTLAGLLGASPGASTATSIMIKLVQQCFAYELATGKYDLKLKEIFPSYGHKLNEDSQLLEVIRERTENVLFEKVI